MEPESNHKSKLDISILINKAKTADYKKIFETILHDLKLAIIYNRQFIVYILLSLLSCILIRQFTIGGFFSFEPLFFDMTVIILAGSLSFFLRPKNRFIYLQILLIIITIMNVINGIYYDFYDFASFSLLASLGQASEVTGAIFEKLKPWHFIYIIMPIIFKIYNSSLKSKDYFNRVEQETSNKRQLVEVLIIGGICLFINMANLDKTDISRLNKQWNRGYVVERFGIIIYQGNDLYQTIRSHLLSVFGYEEAAKNFINYYETNPYQESNNKYTNLLKGYNVITIHMESIMQFLIDYKINGVEVTPNLNKLVKDSMYFDNFYAQVSSGTSSDTEFTYNTSLLPVQLGTVNVSYFNRSYITLQTLLREKGYYSFSMHANKSSMWNRSKMHPSLGYQKFYSEEYFDIDERIGLGLTDASFFTQLEPKIEKINEFVKGHEEYKNWTGTLITLTNHTPFNIQDYVDEPENLLDVRYHTGKLDDNGEEIIFDYLEGSTIGNYLKSAHYADECLGAYIDYVKEHDEYKNTVFVLYGDHAAQLSRTQFKTLFNYDYENGIEYEEGQEGYVEHDYYANELFKKVPLIIWTPNEDKNKKLKGKFSYPMGMIDVLPTIGNMLDIDNKYALGHDIFEIKNKNIIIFPNGNFLTNKVYYYNSKNEYKIISEDQILDDDYIEKTKSYSEEILNLSNDIIVYNLIIKAGNKVGDVENGEE